MSDDDLPDVEELEAEILRLHGIIDAKTRFIFQLGGENERLRAVVETAREACDDLERLRAQQMVIAYPVSVRALRDGLAAFDQEAT